MPWKLLMREPQDDSGKTQTHTLITLRDEENRKSYVFKQAHARMKQQWSQNFHFISIQFNWMVNVGVRVRVCAFFQVSFFFLSICSTVLIGHYSTRFSWPMFTLLVKVKSQSTAIHIRCCLRVHCCCSLFVLLLGLFVIHAPLSLTLAQSFE